MKAIRKIETVKAISAADSFESRQARQPVTSPVTVDSEKLFVEVIEDLSALDRYKSAWEELAENSVEANPFYEQWMLAPAIRSFAGNVDLRLVMVLSPNKANPSGEPVLCGLFPIESRRSDRLPARIISLWKYLFCMICTPLIRNDCAKETLAAFFDWMAKDERGCSIMEFQRIAGEGRFYQLLVEEMHARQLLSFTSEIFARAMLKPGNDADSYLRRAISRQHRKDLNRKQRRLAEIGDLSFEEIQPDGPIEEWIEAFMQIEISGWKGKTGGALASNEANRSFFISIAKEAFTRGRLMLLRARLDGKVIAWKCNFLAGEGSYAFKIAYDESFGHYSPGMLLELENIRLAHERPEIEWMDSCAIPDHPMINRLWLDRRIIQTILVPTRKGRGELLVSIMPLARWLRRKTMAIGGRRRRVEETE